ncbi:MAG: TRAP transporter substrate-binding protein DctP [Alphaproteobacteria bacterium]|nr:TRAP transporter substrate-binding protein DctP [Alphaproteobacteria bacterium]
MLKNTTKHMARRLGAALVGAALIGGAAISAAQAADITLRATANSNENDEDYDGLIVFKDFVESRSNGAIEVELFIGTQLCSKGAECLQGIADGSIDIYISTSGGAAGAFPYVQVLDLPYLLRDDRVAEEALSGDFVRTIRDMALEDSNGTIRLMTIGNTGGWRNFANTKRPIQKPSDMEGLKIRTVVADLPQELVKALGASPTPIPWPELFTSFQTGVVEGSKNGITDIMGMKFPEAGLQYVTLDGHAYMGALWWMNNDRFLGMSEDNRRIIVDGFQALQQATFASPKRKSIQAYQDFVAGGGNLYVPTPAEKAAFKEAAAPVFDWFKENVRNGEAAFDALAKAAAEAEADIDAAHAKDVN